MVYFTNKIHHMCTSIFFYIFKIGNKPKKVSNQLTRISPLSYNTNVAKAI